MSQIRFMEGWLARQLDGQPWVKHIARYSEVGGLKPVGLAVTSTAGQTAQVGMVLGSSMTDISRCGTEEGWSQSATAGPVDANPADPLGWVDALATVIREAAHPHIASVDGFPDSGKPGKQPGLKILLTDGSAGYCTVWSVKR